MLENLIDSGRRLSARLHRYEGVDFSDIPYDERISYSEVYGWINGAGNVVVETFGKDSPQLQRWNEVPSQYEEEWGFITDPYQRMSTLVNQYVGALAEFQAYLSVRSASQPVVQGAPLYVFISYAQSDSELADAIASDLEELSIDYFLDRKDIRWGRSISDSIKSRLKESSHQIIIVSPGSLKSAWVPFEVGYALGSNKEILPFLQHPDLDPPGYIGDLLYLSDREKVREYFRAVLEATGEASDNSKNS